MKLDCLTLQNIAKNITVDEIRFSDFTLFVGASGVGKTQILEAVQTLAAICAGELESAVRWFAQFRNGLDIYTWRGISKNIVAKDAPGDPGIFKFGFESKRKVRFLSEEIKKNQRIVASRNEKGVTFKEAPMPKLTDTASLISLFKDEDDIKDIFSYFKNLQNIYYIPFIFDDIPREKATYKDYEQLLNADLSLTEKFYIAWSEYRDIFLKIEDAFKDIFPFVERLEVIFKNGNAPESNKLLHMKEYGVEKSIPLPEFSSGMIKTLMILLAIFLSPKGSVILIDELENCLGVNCLDAVVDALRDNDRELQAILTSHHPYIINAIPREHWRLVTRDAGVIHSQEVAAKLSKVSKHESFMQLLQLDEFRDGVRARS